MGGGERVRGEYQMETAHACSVEAELASLCYNEPIFTIAVVLKRLL